MDDFTSNFVLPFILAGDTIKGRVIKFDTELDKILHDHNYPEPVSRILAELVMVSALIGTQFKEEIILSVQLKSDYAVKYAIVDFQFPNQIRGYAKFDQYIAYDDNTYQKVLNNNAFLTITIDRQSFNTQRYQGIIEVNNLNISEAVGKYFNQSEQIKTLVKLTTGTLIVSGGKKITCAGGVMIQKLPDNEELWEDASAYFATIKDDELLDPSLTTDDLLYSLFHEMGVKVYDKLNLINKCRCSPEKAKNVIISLGKKEIISLLNDDKLDINCQFCNQSQIFTRDEIEVLFLNK
jgi:molecular chaperone Hsp33